MPIKTMPFDAAAHISASDDQAMLLSDALESGDATYVANALSTIARARGMAQIAREAGVTRTGLYKALSGDGDPRLTTVLGVTKALGIKLVAVAASPEQDAS